MKKNTLSMILGMMLAAGMQSHAMAHGWSEFLKHAKASATSKAVSGLEAHPMQHVLKQKPFLAVSHLFSATSFLSIFQIFVIWML